MSESRKDILLDDPLSGETRTKRKYLLVTSLIGIAMVKAGIVPKKISALGVDLEPPNQGALLYLVSIIITYFLSAFLVYAFTDFISWRKRITIFYEENTKNFFKRMSTPDFDERECRSEFSTFIKEAEERVRFWKKLSPTASTIRALFDFLLPILVSGYAVYIVISLANQKL